MNVLYIAAESDLDAGFYKLCAERVTGLGFADDLVETLRVRKRSGVDAVKKFLRDQLRVAHSRAKAGEAVHFIASMDNDRAPHPENEKRLSRSALCEEEQERQSRLEWIKQAAISVLGENAIVWPVKVAFAVPVEMIESWIIQILDSELDEKALPHFSLADSQRARLYYNRPDPPEQCKDRVKTLHEQSGLASRDEFYLSVVLAMEPDHLASRCHSFAIFKQGLDGWIKG